MLRTSGKAPDSTASVDRGLDVREGPAPLLGSAKIADEAGGDGPSDVLRPEPGRGPGGGARDGGGPTPWPLRTRARRPSNGPGCNLRAISLPRPDTGDLIDGNAPRRRLRLAPCILEQGSTVDQRKRNAWRCGHDRHPVAVGRAEGGRVARCLTCGCLKPARPSPVRALAALRGESPRDGEPQPSRRAAFTGARTARYAGCCTPRRTLPRTRANKDRRRGRGTHPRPLRPRCPALAGLRKADHGLLGGVRHSGVPVNVRSSVQGVVAAHPVLGVYRVVTHFPV